MPARCGGAVTNVAPTIDHRRVQRRHRTLWRGVARRQPGGETGFPVVADDHRSRPIAVGRMGAGRPCNGQIRRDLPRAHGSARSRDRPARTPPPRATVTPAPATMSARSWVVSGVLWCQSVRWRRCVTRQPQGLSERTPPAWPTVATGAASAKDLGRGPMLSTRWRPPVWQSGTYLPRSEGYLRAGAPEGNPSRDCRGGPRVSLGCAPARNVGSPLHLVPGGLPYPRPQCCGCMTPSDDRWTQVREPRRTSLPDQAVESVQ